MTVMLSRASVVALSLTGILLAGGLQPLAQSQQPASVIPASLAAAKTASLPPSVGDIGDARAVVLFFIASDCPISNRTLPEMLRIEHEFAASHVRFFFVYPNTTETAATIRAHRAAYGLGPGSGSEAGGNILTDPRRTLAKLTGANVTPEAAVLIPQGISQDKTLKTVYTGRIDDRYLSLGTERPAATRHDLEEAIAAVLNGHPVPAPGGPAIGCAFMTLAAK